MALYTITPKAPTFSTPIALASFASSATPGAKTSLDLTTKKGATLNCFIGRNAATALTRAARIAIRRTVNSTRRGSDNYDFISSIAAVNATTVSSGGAAAAVTMVVASATGIAADQWLCAQSSGARGEFFQISDLSSTTVTHNHPSGFLVSHSASDVVTNGADVGSIYIPGGDIWDIWVINNSGQTIVALCEVAVDSADEVN